MSTSTKKRSAAVEADATPAAKRVAELEATQELPHSEETPEQGFGLDLATIDDTEAHGVNLSMLTEEQRNVYRDNDALLVTGTCTFLDKSGRVWFALRTNATTQDGRCLVFKCFIIRADKELAAINTVGSLTYH